MSSVQEKVKSTLTGLWHNQHGSEIDITVDSDGKISGSFALHKSIKQNERYPVIGFANEDIVTFCADFSRHGSMTAWVGQFTAQESCFEAMWHTVVDMHRNPEKSWKAVLTGSDSFIRGRAPDSLAPSTKPASHPMYSGLI